MPKEKEHINVAMIGHVDHGKSTMIGRLLYEAGEIPEHIIEKMVEGRLRKFYEENCLLKQPYIRDDRLTIEDLLNELMAKTGEKIVIRRFVRYQVGEELE